MGQFKDSAELEYNAILRKINERRTNFAVDAVDVTD